MKKPTLKSRCYNFSSDESKERIKKVLEKQKMIRMGARKPSVEQMRKITFTI